MSFYSEIVKFFRKTIARSGLILDEDALFLNADDWYDEDNSFLPLSTLLIGSLSVGFYATVEGKIDWLIASATVGGIPLFALQIMSWYNMFRSRRLKNNLEKLLEAFNELSKVRAVLPDFLICYNKQVYSSTAPFKFLPPDAVVDMFCQANEIDSQIIAKMTEIISELHLGLRDFKFDVDTFKKSMSSELHFRSIEDCFKNISIQDSRIILLRSNMLITMYLMCTKQGDPKYLVRVVEKVIPELVKLISESILRINACGKKIRYVEEEQPVAPQVEVKPYMGEPINSKKIRRDILRITNRLRIALMKLKNFSVTLDTDEQGCYLDELERLMGETINEMDDCFEATRFVQEYISILNGKRKGGSSENETAKKSFIPPNDSQKVETEEKTLQSGSDKEEEDQEFEAYTRDDESDPNELSSTFDESIVSRRDLEMRQTSLLRELQSHDAFKKKQLKFTGGKGLFSSTPNNSIVSEEEKSPSSDVGSPVSSITGDSSNPQQQWREVIPNSHDGDIRRLLDHVEAQRRIKMMTEETFESLIPEYAEDPKDTEDPKGTEDPEDTEDPDDPDD